MINEVIFDVETQKFFDEIDTDDPADLGVSIVSVYQRTLDGNLKEESGKLVSFWEKEFEELWELFQNADRIVGFNTIHFDIPALQPYAIFPLEKLSHFDMFPIIRESAGRRISLNDLAKDTLEIEKSDNPVNAIRYWRKGDKISLAKLQKYCEDDVIITKDLYDFGLKNKFLKFKDRWNTSRTIDVDFSYPEKGNESLQEGLF